MDEQTKPAYAALMSVIRTASQLAAQDINFFETMDSSLASSSRETSSKLLDLVNRISSAVSIDDEELDKLQSLEDVNTKWKDFSGLLDKLFEKVDASIDEMKKGNVVPPSKTNDETTSAASTTSLSSGNGQSPAVQRHARGIAKPQETFSRKVDNSIDHPFKPLLTSKPNSLVSLEESIQMEQGQELSDPESDAQEIALPHYKQPYQYEIENQPYPELAIKEPQPFLEWGNNSVIYVDTEDKLKKMIKKLKKASEIAVDLEHHDYRSYHGFVCLMQISDRNDDYIVDTLALRDELQALNVVFTDPAIIKVFHGAFMDIIWLQRDFGLYIVSLFDTYHASKALGLQRNSLAFLLETYAKFHTSKKYQLADWRIRPIPHEMLGYAQADTHFLLNIFDKLRNKLIEKNQLDTVLQDSREVAKKRYEIPAYANQGTGWRSLLNKYNLTPAQQIVLKELYAWRDRMARVHDESPGYIMPNHFLISLCYNMPDTSTAVIGTSNNTTPFVRSSAREIARIIENCKKLIEQDRLDRLEQAEKEASVDDVEMDDEKLLDNYDAYEREFKKALKKQSSLFGNSTKLMAGTSSFFGNVLEMYNVESEPDRSQFLLHVPLPPELSSGEEEDEQEDEESESENEQEAPVAESKQPEPEAVDENSVTQEAKPTEVDTKPGTEDEISLHVPHSKRSFHETDMPEEFMNSKQRRKAKRKKLRLMEKEQISKMVDEKELEHDKEEDDENGQEDGQPEDQPEVFDYSSAPKVLLTASDKRAQQREKKKQEKKEAKKEIFDPYANVNSDSHVPKPARKRKPATGGKTMTFKKKSKK